MQIAAAAAVSPTPIPPDGDVNRGLRITTITWVEFGIALILLVARTWTRIRVIRSWGWDDAIMYLALICACINSALLQVSLYYGTGRHIYYLTDHQALMANKYNWISQGFHVMSATWGKVSIAVFLLRIVDRAKAQRHYFYAGITLLVIVNAASTGIIYGQCKNPTDLWATKRKGSCWDPIIHRNVAFAQGSFSALSDLVLALYPLIIICNLQMARRLKLIVSFVMMLGVVAMAAAIVKTVYLDKLAARGDYTFETADLCIWVATEQYLIIIAACIPALAPLFKMARAQSARYSSSRPRFGYGQSARSNNKTTASDRRHLRGGSGKLNSTRSETHDFGIYPLGDYSVKTWTPRHETEAGRNDGDSEEATVPNMDCEADDTQHGGIMKTLEVQVKSDRESEIRSGFDIESRQQRRGFMS